MHARVLQAVRIRLPNYFARAVLAARLPACTPTPRPTRPDKEQGNGRGILCKLEHGADCTTFVRHHYRVYRSYARPRRCRRPAARRFVRDVQSAVRLSVSPSRLTSRRTYRQSHGTLGVLNEWPSCRSTAASGSRITAIHTIVMS